MSKKKKKNSWGLVFAFGVMALGAICFVCGYFAKEWTHPTVVIQPQAEPIQQSYASDENYIDPIVLDDRNSICVRVLGNGDGPNGKHEIWATTNMGLCPCLCTAKKSDYIYFYVDEVYYLRSVELKAPPLSDLPNEEYPLMALISKDMRVAVEYR